MRKEDKFKPYVYKVYNRNGKLEEYSGYFSTKEEAINWRTKKGEWLSNHFKRELILTLKLCAVWRSLWHIGIVICFSLTN